MSSNRKCNVCGRWISLRKMPHGQWVAFEGYDTPHNHYEPPPRSTQSASGVYAGRSPGTFSTQANIRQLLVDAVNSKRVVRVRYRSRIERFAQATDRDIEPLNVDAIHCYAYCRLRRDYRTFRVDSFESVYPTAEYFAARATASGATTFKPPVIPTDGPSPASSKTGCAGQLVTGLIIVGVIALVRSCSH